MNLDDEPIQINASLKDSKGDIISAEVNWLSSNNAVAEVSRDGTIYPKGAGSCTITASVGDVQSTCIVKVSVPVSDVEYVEYENGYEYIDLGLSVKWATFNVGATTPEEYGDYFAWGETEPYYEDGYAEEDPQTHLKDGKSAGYSWSSYKYCNGTYYSLTKYCNYSKYGNNGFTDTNTTILPEDDVAHVQWGGDWRMPTQAEFEELLSNCTWTLTTENGVEGYKVISRKTGYKDHSIFLPATGYRDNTGIDLANGYYWSSSLYTGDPKRAWILLFGSGEYHDTSDSYRHCGLSVRPVCP